MSILPELRAAMPVAAVEDVRTVRGYGAYLRPLWLGGQLQQVGMKVDVHGSSIPARRRVNSVPTDRVRVLLAVLHVRVALA